MYKIIDSVEELYQEIEIDKNSRGEKLSIKKIQELSFLQNDVEFATHLTHDKDTFIHTHSFYEIFYVTEGEITHIQNGKRQLIKTGDMKLDL